MPRKIANGRNGDNFKRDAPIEKASGAKPKEKKGEPTKGNNGNEGDLQSGDAGT